MKIFTPLAQCVQGHLRRSRRVVVIVTQLVT
jgi:hypothetical protein